MIQFCIYREPKDAKPGYPYVVRRWEIGHQSVRPCEALGAVSLEAARSVIPEGMVMLSRAPEDDPCIVEVWL